MMLGKDAHLLVIGGARGLGFELARTAVAQGARVTVTGRDADVAAARAAELGPPARGLACDLLDAGSVGRLFGDLDVVDHLVLTAIERDHNTVAGFRADAAARMMLIKTVGYANAVAHALPKLDPGGSVVLFSGLSMWRPSPGSTTMSMANSAIPGLVNSLAVEIAPVRVNAITPGTVAGTEAIDNADPVRAEFFEAQRLRTPAKRLPTPQDIVEAVLFLLTCSSVNGENLVVDAGAHLL
ncbi:SDR family oxidoreductase [Amycolatopsis saalfeldensis]|uniref:NAD(P)-dependent dehydrogenase, short-chain alcohol dehydrogenase family n=1 Tax=Amycolatopsis saalfeldensis TaxID=394193 RepID=A0A1H8YPX8_9PSEU|nr:SDR family oxidoreductase [Amycolatopsis saalfeldensis]SEP54264.1 NAD(P)-dependent dehydrogenase, short-chain alcohol dehydrogenase family [Amycolatopsis saalfeldensis]